LQITPQVVPSQVAWSAFRGIGQTMQWLPQESARVGSTQVDPESTATSITASATSVFARSLSLTSVFGRSSLLASVFA
jgi:hypothetical protein